MYVQRNTEARTCNHCCSGKGRSTAYSESVFVALSTQHAMGMRDIVVCGCYGSTAFFPHYLINGTSQKVAGSMRSLVFFIHLIPPAPLWPWVWLNL
jgi:hypothetical protein